MTNVNITPQLIEHIAKVSRIKLNADEKKEFEKDFKEVLNAFSVIDEFNEDVSFKIHPIETKNELREDVIEKSLTQEEALRNTIKKKDGFFVGPKVI